MSDKQAEATDADDADESAAESDEADGLQRGDFVKLDYTLRTTDDDEVIDTTDEEIAEEAGFADDDNRDFSPRTIIIGDGHVFEAVDESLIGSEVGDSDSVIISPEDGFGEHDPEQVRTISAEKIPEDDRYPGATVQIDREQGHIETIIGGRARVNFNHPLAGEELEYEYEIVSVVEDCVEKAEGVLGMYLQDVPNLWIETDEVEEEVTVEGDEDDEPETELQTVEKETLYIEATQQLTMNQQWMMQKSQIAQEIMTKLDLDRVIVQEILDGGGMGGMGGMLGGMGGGGGDIEDALEDADLDDMDLDDVDIDADELAESLDE